MRIALNVHEIGCKFRETGLIGILTTYGCFMKKKYETLRGREISDVIKKYVC